MQISDKIVPKLNELLTREYDSEFGYKEAAKSVEDVRLIEFFKGFEEKRFHFANDLKGEINRLNGSLNMAEGIKGSLERFWMRLKAVISTKDERAILAECSKIEMETWENYNQALSIKELPDETRKLLRKHKTNIDEALYQIIELKEDYGLKI